MAEATMAIGPAQLCPGHMPCLAQEVHQEDIALVAHLLCWQQKPLSVPGRVGRSSPGQRRAKYSTLSMEAGGRAPAAWAAAGPGSAVALGQHG